MYSLLALSITLAQSPVDERREADLVNPRIVRTICQPLPDVRQQTNSELYAIMLAAYRSGFTLTPDQYVQIPREQRERSASRALAVLLYGAIADLGRLTPSIARTANRLGAGEDIEVVVATLRRDICP